MFKHIATAAGALLALALVFIILVRIAVGGPQSLRMAPTKPPIAIYLDGGHIATWAPTALDPAMGKITFNLDNLTEVEVKLGQRSVTLTANDVMTMFEGRGDHGR